MKDGENDMAEDDRSDIAALTADHMAHLYRSIAANTDLPPTTCRHVASTVEPVLSMRDEYLG